MVKLWRPLLGVTWSLLGLLGLSQYTLVLVWPWPSTVADGKDKTEIHHLSGIHTLLMVVPPRVLQERRRRETEAESQLWLASSHERSARSSMDEPIWNGTEPGKVISTARSYVVGTQIGGIRSNRAHLTPQPDITVNNLYLWTFVHFKSYLLKFRRHYKLLCLVLANIRAFLQNWSILCCHFRNLLYKKWPLQALSFVTTLCIT